MQRELFFSRAAETQRSNESVSVQPRVPGKRTLTEGLAVQRREAAAAPIADRTGREPVATGAVSQPTAAGGDMRPTLHRLFGIQRVATAEAAGDPENVHAAAARGTATPTTRLPFADQIQRSFGRHDISGIQAHVGAEATASARAMAAQAYATGDHVVLGQGTDLHTVAHEAAHVIQQRGGVQLKGGVGQAGDAYEGQADAVADLVVQGRSAEHLLDHAGAASTPGSGVQRKLVIDEMFTANTAKLGGQVKKLESLKAVAALIEKHPLNELMAIDVYVEGGKQDRKTAMGSTFIQTIDGKAVAKSFLEYPMTESLIRAREMQIGMKVNVEPDAYDKYDKDGDHDDTDSLGDMIATFLHEVQLHVLPKMDQMVALKKADPGKHGKLEPSALKALSPAMARVMGASHVDDHDDPGTWAKLLDGVEGVAKELTQSDDQGQWKLAYSAVMSVVNDVMTHTTPEPGQLGLPNLTRKMPPKEKKALYRRADELATLFKAQYSKKFPEDDDSSGSDQDQ
jgi:hypothetical protein